MNARQQLLSTARLRGWEPLVWLLAFALPWAFPGHALIVNEVLSNAELRRQYYGDCAGLADRIGTMRLRLIEELAAVGSTHDWSHVKNQIGMFAFTGMTAAMCDELTERHAIDRTRDGRISLPGLNSGNLAFVASAIHEVTNGKSIGSAK
jgi:aspartate aminotransferase